MMDFKLYKLYNKALKKKILAQKQTWRLKEPKEDSNRNTRNYSHLIFDNGIKIDGGEKTVFKKGFWEKYMSTQRKRKYHVPSVYGRKCHRFYRRIYYFHFFKLIQFITTFKIHILMPNSKCSSHQSSKKHFSTADVDNYSDPQLEKQ